MVLVYLSEGGWEGTQELELRSPYLVVGGDVRAWGLLEERIEMLHRGHSRGGHPWLTGSRRRYRWNIDLKILQFNAAAFSFSASWS